MNQPSDPSTPARPRASTEIGPGTDALAQTESGEDSVPPGGADDPVVGRVLSGLYRIGERIGEGGMGAVYRAEHINLKKEFAIKVLVPDAASRETSLERLRQEAIAASSIDHRNIVRVVNLDETDDGMLFIVMELLKGQSLADRIEQGVLNAEDAIEIALQVCSALQATHARGIVHRDLKPDNIFLTTAEGDTVVKVLDFGISKVKRDDTDNVRVTATGQLVGTPLYMSPEQAKGETDMDHRVDIYALGVLLYEMVAGEPPFTGSNYFQILWKHGNEEPPRPSSHDHARAIPHVLEEAILRALSKDPEARFESMSSFAEELRRVRSTVRPPPAAHGKQRWRWVAGIALALCGLVAIGVGALNSQAEETPVPLEQTKTLTDVPEPAADTADNADPKVRDTEGETGKPLPPTLRFELKPANAEVQIDNVVLRGPDTYTLHAYDPNMNEGKLQIEVRRRGYQSEVITLDPRQNATVRATLKRARSKPSATGPMITEY